MVALPPNWIRPKKRCFSHRVVSAYVTPVMQNGETVEYQSVRTQPAPERVAVAEAHYAALRTVQPVLADIPREIEEAAACLGAKPLQVFRYILVPA